MRSAVAEHARQRARAEVLALSAGRRVRLAFELGNRDAELYCAATGADREGARPVVLIAGRPSWQREIPRPGQQIELDSETLLAAQLADLICLKLYAGGPQDLWHVQQLMEAHNDRDEVVRRVTTQVRTLPEDARQAWGGILESVVE